MDGYNATILIATHRADYIPLVERCLNAHKKGIENPYWLGFQWDDEDIMAWPVMLARLATHYGLLKISYKSNSARCYQVIDPEGVKSALQDIGAGKIAWSNAKEVRPLKLWLSPKTMGRLNTYVKKEMPGQWEGEALVVERALNTFLDCEAPS